MEGGTCAIKPEFIIPRSRIDEKESNNINSLESDLNNTNGNNSSEPPAKKIKLRGRNKSRPRPFKVPINDKICAVLNNVLENENKSCSYANCKFQHDASEYLKNKPKDIGDTCYIYSLRGFCPNGISCRFGSSHITPNGRNIKSEKYVDFKPTTLNFLNLDVQIQLSKKTYNFDLAKNIVKKIESDKNRKSDTEEIVNTSSIDNEDNKNESKVDANSAIVSEAKSPITSGCVTDEDIIKLRTNEKKVIDWKNKLFLSPLTTVGNLPFRRICKEYGADVTCGEMACSVPIINGARQEWALTRKHESEDIFGVQLCGNKAHLVAYAAQVIREKCEIDFVDINLGCPIELIYQQGGGSAMLRRQGVLEVLIRSCSTLLDIPLTVKTRTGVYASKNVAHKLIPKFKEWGASLVTIHGRSREQRYTRLADWEYIEECAKTVNEENNENSFPIIGNGDIYSFEDFAQAKERAPHISGVMLGRGALIKPWLFTEIKEQKMIDISSTERFDILKRYVNYGLEHWGSDTMGVENTRRFLLEWLSFLHRYVPVGLLERPPQKINQRPQDFFGRNDLETLMASTNCADWIKISEMLLGPVPEGFNFLPKHKANSFS